MKPKIPDFPDWFGPMLVKELRQGLKTRGFVFSFIGLQTVLVLVLVYHVLLYSRAPKGFDASGLGAIFWFLLGALLVFVTPLRAFNELAAERKANTLELIFMSGLSAWRIAFGKWVSLLFQALLFLLAVLPYAILRYYFGAVDLAQDLHGMLMVMLLCAVLSAVALAISGMPLWVRIITMIGVVICFMSSLGLFQMLIFSPYGSSRASSMLSWTDETNWWLVGWDIVLVCLIALQVAAATVAPPAENHAGAQRFLTLLLWLPLPVMGWQSASESALLAQVFLFVVIAGVLVWYQLSVKPSEMVSHCRPFRQWRAAFGLPFQPGWPSAVVFLLIVVGLYAFTISGAIAYGTKIHDAEDRAWFHAAFAMPAAALLCSTFVWILFRQKARFPLLFQTLFLILCGVAVALIVAGKPPTTHLGEYYIFGFLPPSAVWAMMDQSNDYAYSAVGVVSKHRVLVATSWSTIAYLALASYALLLIFCSRKYWRHYFRTCFAAPREPIPSEP
ncbi:MAG TPA: hypothetical protein VGO11_27325 [Chthoniobacteraceae bacterium]|jgi:hypothetical protein|nr:hypothetical protein [Chthoniobacteraceae bacterium]